MDNRADSAPRIPLAFEDGWKRAGQEMQLIIGNRHVIPEAIHRIAGGVQAVLKGEGLRALLDATFHGTGSIEVLGGDLDRRPMDVAAIEMTGGDTRVTLICTGSARPLM